MEWQGLQYDPVIVCQVLHPDCAFLLSCICIWPVVNCWQNGNDTWTDTRQNKLCTRKFGDFNPTTGRFFLHMSENPQWQLIIFSRRPNKQPVNNQPWVHQRFKNLPRSSGPLVWKRGVFSEDLWRNLRMDRDCVRRCWKKNGRARFALVSPILWCHRHMALLPVTLLTFMLHYAYFLISWIACRPNI